MLEEVVIGKKSLISTGYRLDQAEISDNTFLPIILRGLHSGGYDRCTIVISKLRITAVDDGIKPCVFRDSGF